MQKPKIAVHISPRQEKALMSQSKTMGISVAEVVRRVLDAQLFPEQHATTAK